MPASAGKAYGEGSAGTSDPDPGHRTRGVPAENQDIRIKTLARLWSKLALIESRGSAPSRRTTHNDTGEAMNANRIDAANFMRLIAAAALLAVTPVPADAQDSYPSHAVRII